MPVRKPTILFEPGFRSREELFSAPTWARLIDAFEVLEGAQLSGHERAQVLNVMGAYIADRPALSPHQLSQARNLKAIIEVAGAFHDDMDYGACLAAGIEVLSCAPGFRQAVAEMALGMILALGRGLIDEHEAFRRGAEAWLEDQPARDFSLFHQRVGFIGYGQIAKEVHRLMTPFDVDVVAYDPWLSHMAIKSVSLETLVSQSRVILIAAAPTAENRGLVSADLIAAMQPGTLVVLMSRAYCVDWKALVQACAAGRIRLATDVFPEEPLAPDAPLRGYSNVLLSPHRAAAVVGGRWPIGQMIVQDLKALFAGKADRALKVATPDTVASLAKAQRLMEQTP